MNIIVQSDSAPETGPVLNLSNPWDDAPTRQILAERGRFPLQPEVRALEIAVLKSLQKIAAFPFEGNPFAIGTSAGHTD